MFARRGIFASSRTLSAAVNGLAKRYPFGLDSDPGPGCLKHWNCLALDAREGCVLELWLSPAGIGGPGVDAYRPRFVRRTV